MSEELLTVGKRGEIFTTKRLRVKTRIREGGRVKASIVDGKLVIEPVPALEEVLRNPVIRVKSIEAERLSEEAQKEAGAYG